MTTELWFEPEPVDPDVHKKLRELADRVSTEGASPMPKSLEAGCSVDEVAQDWKHGLGRLLLDSAISTPVAKARGYAVVTRRTDASGYGFSKDVASLVSDSAHALLVPLWDIAEKSKSPTSYQLRPKTPRDPNRKYESLAGRSPVLDVNPLMRDATLNPAIPLWITEGARKADALASLGVPCINLSGVDCWVGRENPQDKSTPTRPLPSWDVVPLRDREVIVCFDSDAETKAEVEQALGKLAGFLKRKGANVSIARLAHADDGSKQGIDDYLGAGGLLDDVPIEQYTGDGRPRFRVDSTQQVLQTLRHTLGTGALTGFYRRNGVLVHVPVIGEDGYRPPPEGEDDGPAQVRPVTTAYLRNEIDVQFHVIKTVRKRTVPALVPTDPTAIAVEVAGGWTTVPRIEVVTHTPMMRPDGTVLATAGYDAESKTLLLPPRDLFLKPVPERLNDEAAEWAVTVLNGLVCNFPFESDDARANYFALLLTPLLRLILPPPYPLFILNAHQPGTGKTLLSQVARGLHGGVHRPELPQQDDELRKQISGILTTTTAPVVIWDNASERIKSPILAGLLTERSWNDRLLGVNRDLSADNDRIWVTTGNNVLIGGDMARRCLWISLDAKMERPETRPLESFAQPDLLGYVAKQRGLLLTALLVLARRWVDAGKPMRTERSDSYAVWAGAVAEMLGPFGLTEAFAGQKQAPVTLSDDDEELGHLLRALYARFGTTNFQVRDVQQAMRNIDQDPTGRDLSDAMPTAIKGKQFLGSDIGKSLGRYLLSNEKRFVNGVRVAKVGDGRGGALWRLELVS